MLFTLHAYNYRSPSSVANFDPWQGNAGEIDDLARRDAGTIHKAQDRSYALVFDTHAHMDTRPYEDFELMGVAGVTDVLTLAHDPMRMSTPDVLLDHFHKLVHGEVRRGAENGINVHVGLGVHPRSINDKVDATLQALPEYLSHPAVVAIGEIGLERCTDVEERVFRAQLGIDYYPKVIHTPRRAKREALERITAIVDDVGAKDVVIDHIDPSSVDLALEAGTYIGLTVQPGKASVRDAVELIIEYAEAKFVVNSDLSAQRSDCLSVARVMHALTIEGYDDRAQKACVQNGRDLFLR
ncbi:MAG: TatD family hydrolase [Halobacteriota archaeon]